MKVLLFLLCLFSSLGGYAQVSDHLRVFSYNIRMNSPKDGINIWENRKNWLAKSIEFFEGDIVGAQEVTHTQLTDLKELLSGYAVIGEGRQGGEKGEYSPIFYNKKMFDLLNNQTFWLSETPENVGSKSWDAALPRIVTWAKFKDKKGRIFYVFNTHFDHKGKIARIESSVLLATKIKEIAGNAAVIVTGDFNIPPESEPYRIFMHRGIQDPFLELDDNKIYTPGYTFNNWDIEASGDRYRIDYVFYKGDFLSPQKYFVLDGQRGKRFISDHFPVIVLFKWQNQN